MLSSCVSQEINLASLGGDGKISMQHVVQHVASNVASNVVQQVAAYNTYRALCKFVACNSQQFRANPILLSVACNKFKYGVQQPIKTRLSDHVIHRRRRQGRLRRWFN